MVPALGPESRWFQDWPEAPVLGGGFWVVTRGASRAVGTAGALGTPWDLLHQDTAWLIPQPRGDGVQVAPLPARSWCKAHGGAGR